MADRIARVPRRARQTYRSGFRPVVCSFLVLALASCGSSENRADPSVSSTVTVPSSTSAGPSTVDVSIPSATEVGPAGNVVNTWVGPSVDITKLPIGTDKVSLTGPAVGGLFACDAGFAGGGGAHAAGPWIDEAAGTWNLSAKVSVRGEVSWPMATYSEVIEGTSRVISSNGLPVDEITGEFPIAPDDPAYAYDRNPNRIAGNEVEVVLPLNPAVAPTATCLGKGGVGVLKNGVSLFAPIDERNRDAAAYETQDECDGHPQQTSVYHYHEIPSCIRDASVGSSTVVGFAFDGFPIVVERDGNGNLPTNADLDECHGRISRIELDGAVVETYHYSATFEFPYFIGCFKGVPVA